MYTKKKQLKVSHIVDTVLFVMKYKRKVYQTCRIVHVALKYMLILSVPIQNNGIATTVIPK